MEQTTPDLQAQIDQLSLALREWRDSQEHALPAEDRLAQLSERCAEILNRWADTDQRHAEAVSAVEARLTDWTAIESRLEHDSAQRIRALERVIEHEWQTLKQLHTEPVRQLREQTVTLGETCVAATNLALRGFERAEARLAALETGLQERLTQLSRDVQMAVAEIRREGGKPSAIGTGGVAPFPLEGVMRIHDELRDTEPAGGELVPMPQDAPARGMPPDLHAVAVHHVPDTQETTHALVDRMAQLERAVSSGKQAVRDSTAGTARVRRDSRLALGIGVAALIAAAVLWIVTQRQTNAQLADAASRVAAAEHDAAVASETANKQIATARADSERQIAEARQAALTAQVVSSVLAAPDLTRFNLSSPDATARAYAQVLWSRSRGLVVSASRLPATAEGSTYQVWLLSDGSPISAGTVLADSEGRATLATDTLPTPSRGITGVMMTVEPAGGSLTPSATVVLARPPQ